MKILCFALAIALNIYNFEGLALAADDYSILINRKTHMLYVLDGEGKRVFDAPCGIGRGGLKKKQSMSDSVTPTGEFTVDIILSDESSAGQISEADKEKFLRNKKFSEYVADRSGLKHLFDNMNNIDFDGDKKPDIAYGAAYIGLDSGDAITGPKMKMFDDTPYWYSIAIHGTNTDANIGRSNSGGCIHLREEALNKLIKEFQIKIGTKVTIVDEGP